MKVQHIYCISSCSFISDGEMSRPFSMFLFECCCWILYLFQVLRTALSNRLAKVQGFLFRAAFLGRIPVFVRLIVENLTLCFLQSTLFSTAKFLTGSLGLRFRKILTDLIHVDYFKVNEISSVCSLPLLK